MPEPWDIDDDDLFSERRPGRQRGPKKVGTGWHDVLRDRLQRLRDRPPRRFRRDRDVLERFTLLRQARDLATAAATRAEWHRCAALRSDAHASFHRVLRASGDTRLGGWCAQHGFSVVEADILLLLVTAVLGDVDCCGTVGQVAQDLKEIGHDPIAVFRCFTRDAPLLRSGSLELGHDDEPAERPVGLAQQVYEPLLHRRGRRSGRIATWKEWLEGTYQVTRVLYENSETCLARRRGYGRDGRDPGVGQNRLRRAAQRHFAIADEHPDWPFSQLPDLGFYERILILTLLGKELGHYEQGDSIFTGEGLAAGLAWTVPAISSNLRCLHPRSPLMRKGLVRPCGGRDADDPLTTSPGVLAATEFELTDSCLGRLEVERRARDGLRSRRTTTGFAQLVLPAAVREPIDLALAQCRHCGTLLETWGMRSLVPYGRGVTILFAGPPGLGKTASAEALAHELGKPILAVDYSQVQNCFVGQTEKNIVAAFQTARAEDAVLFWDEADSMFFDRDSAQRNFEARDVNVLLTELERFDGVCILATNRRGALDKALERRLTLRVDFLPPGPEERVRLWRIFLGGKLPLARGVTPEALAGPELTGAQIKNAVLNAARGALTRGRRTRLRREDFERAISMELAGSDTDIRVGFALEE